jgi:hypothetical protein
VKAEDHSVFLRYFDGMYLETEECHENPQQGKMALAEI